MTLSKGYNQQQNKRHPQRCLLAHFEATLYSNLLPHNNITISHYVQVKSLYAKIECIYVSKLASKHLWGIIYFAVDGIIIFIYILKS